MLLKRILLTAALLVLGATIAARAADAAPKRSNILFIMVDDLNHWVGYLGRNKQTITPNMDRLSAAGMSFTRACCAAPVCNPSRTAMFSGLRPGSTGVYGNANDWRPVVPEDKTMITTLRKGGYEMLGAGKLYHMGFDRRSEYDDYLQETPTPGEKNPIVVESHGRPASQGSPRRHTVVRDITERKAAERALRESGERLGGIIRSAMDAIITMDARQRVILFNPAAERVFRCQAAEAIGQPLDRFIPERHRSAHAEHVRRFEQTGVTNRQVGALGQLSGLRADGEEFPIEAAISQVEVGGEKLFTVILRDITERKRAEQALQRVNTELERSNRDLEQFAYVASHDLQEPLRALAGYVQLLENRYRDKLDEKALHYIAEAGEGAARMERLIHDLLAFSRVGTRGMAFAPTDLETVLDQVLRDFQVRLQESGAQVAREPLPTLNVDPTQIGQLFQNLIGNALKFRGTTPPKIHIGAHKDESQWRLWVRDNGIGIEPQYFDRIFHVFQRLHTRKQFPGTGIGLAICKKIVERHGGKIWVESEPGHGTSFYFTIPEGPQPEISNVEI